MTNGASVLVDDAKCERRTMINLTKEQHEWVRKAAFETNKSISAVIRAAIDAAMQTGKTG
jgi:uncharacterized protein (DUF1778 family)